MELGNSIMVVQKTLMPVALRPQVQSPIAPEMSRTLGSLPVSFSFIKIKQMKYFFLKRLNEINNVIFL